MMPAVDRVTSLMAGWSRPWGIAGGWALDLWRGRVTRSHADIEIAVLREHQLELREWLVDHRWAYVDNHAHVPWSGQRLELPIHELVATRGDERLEVLLNERDGTNWVFRRDPRVRLELDHAFVVTSSGVPVLAPEIALLYKAKQRRAVDDADFAEHAPALSRRARAWLETVLRVWQPGHPWIAALI